MEFDCVNYVIGHKPWTVDQSDMYKALAVGKERIGGWLYERDGENISRYNERINELTGLYWIWKNTDEPYVGLSHYRRFFRMYGQRLSARQAMELLVYDGYDIILPETKTLDWSLRENMEMVTGQQLGDETYTAFLEAIWEHQPEYVDAYREVMDGKTLYQYSMFMTSRKVMEEYCKWLFSFILEAADRIHVDGLDYYPRRAAGYYGECMMTVWMKRQQYRVKTLPVVTG